MLSLIHICVEEAKNIAQNEMGVEFIYPDITPFKEKVKNMQQDMIKKNPSIVDIYLSLIHI